MKNMWSKKWLLLLLLGFGSFIVNAQVPVGQPVTIRILSYDTTALDYYNIYAVEYSNSDSRGSTEVIVLKENDPLLRVTTKEVKLCAIDKMVMKVIEGKKFTRSFKGATLITLNNKYGDKTTLNIDPSSAGAVVQLCE